MVAADLTAAQSIVVMKTDESKIHKLSPNLLMAVSGESGDCTQFSEFIAKNIQLYRMRNEYELSPTAAATYTRKNMADSLRSSSPYNVNLLVAGYDQKDGGAKLFFLDYLASCISVPYAGHGYGSFFAISAMDRYHKDDLSEHEGYELMKKCIREVQKRLIINLPNFSVSVVDQSGVRNLPNITVRDLLD